jgi:butyryl-CoA dehydrogenase
MNFELSDAQRMMKEMVRDFAEKEIKPRAADIDKTDEFPWDLWRRMADLGLIGMTLPTEHGGSGMDIVSWAIAQEEMARASVVVADIQLLSTLMQNMILRNGTDAQKAKHLPALAAGEKICVIAQTEPGTGSDVAGIQTTAKPERDGYVLNGTKRFITCAMLADLAIVVATVDKSKGSKGITLFIVEKGTPGFAPGAKEHLLGVRGMGTGEIVLDNCWVPRENMLGGEGEGFKRAMISLDTGRIGIGCQALGLSQAAMEEAVRYAKQRTAFGGPIGNLQAVQHKLADMSAGIEAARLRLLHAAWLKDQGRSIIREAAEAKLLASELAVRVTNEALQIHGGYGYSTDFPIERMYREAKVYTIWEGTSEIQRMVIARQLLKEY